MRALTAALVLGLAGSLAACDSAGPEPTPQPIAATAVVDLPADPTTGRDAQGRPTGTTNQYTLYSLREDRIVLRSTDTDRTAEASTAWDIGFRGTSVIVNGGTSGPGQGAIQILPATFEEVEEAPAGGYLQDVPGQPAIPPGSGSGWYTYTAIDATNPARGGYITPTPGRVLVIRTATGTYAKVRILNYYLNRPTPPFDPFTVQDRHYTFEFVHQPDGTRLFNERR